MTTPAWRSAPVLTVAAFAVASGMAAFSVTAVVGDVAATFGSADDGPFAGVGSSVTTLGVGLAVVRLASLGALPLAALADRAGRRPVLLTTAAVGLALTSLAALAPSFWWYVALVALARPALASVNAVAGVVAAEETRARDRAAAIAVVTAGYGLGSGIVSVARGLLPGEPSFRVVTAFALVPLLLLPLLARSVHEPTLAVGARRRPGWPGAVPRHLRRRVVVLAWLVGAIAVATGPGFTYLFVYAEGVLSARPLEVSVLVIAAGPAGLVGLLLGRWLADRFGRRTAGAVAMVGTGGAVALAYASGFEALAVGYLGTILLASAFAPAQGALAAELVPTAVRATVAGWVTVAGVAGAVVGLAGFGVLSDATGRFSVAGVTVGAVAAVSAVGFRALPETRGTELTGREDAAPGPPAIA